MASPSIVREVYQNTVLIVKINEAKKLPSSSADTFCVLRVDNQEVARTATVYKTNEPFWGEEYTLHIPTEFQTMSVYIYDVDQIMGGKESVGKVRLDRDQICASPRGLDRWFPLTRIVKADEVQGEVLVEVCIVTDRNEGHYRGKITLIEGRDLAPKDPNGYADSYAKLVFKNQKSATKIVHKTRFPKWYHAWEFTAADPIQEDDVVNITVYGCDKFSKNDFMGQVNIELSELELNTDYRTWLRLQLKDPPAENGKKSDELGSLRLKVQVHEQRILPNRYYDHFTDFMVKAVQAPRLAPTGSEMLIMLEKVMTLDRNTLAHTMVRFFISSGAVISYLDCLTARELLSTTHPHTLFRNNSLASKSYDQFMKIIAMPYLHGLLKPHVDQMYEDKRVVELDPAQLDRGKHKRSSMQPDAVAAHSKTIDQSVEIIAMYCSQILDRICGSAEQCPRILRVALRQLWQRVEERFCGSEYKDIPYIAISSFIFLRFFIPAILSPKLFSLREHHPDQRTERTLKLVSKVLQNIGNLTPEVDAKELFMKPMIPFIQESLGRAKKYILDLIQIDQKLVREETKLKAGEYLQTLILLQGYLNKRTSHGSVLGNPFKRRYFYLSSVLLQFGKEPDDPQMCSYPVKWISVVEKLDGGAYHKKHMFQVTVSEPQCDPEALYLEAADVNEQNLWVSALRKACLCNRHMDNVFHPGAFRSRVWTCCKSQYKSEPGCSPAHRSVILGDWRDPLDPDVDAQTIFSQFLQGRQVLVSNFLSPKISRSQSVNVKSTALVSPTTPQFPESLPMPSRQEGDVAMETNGDSRTGSGTPPQTQETDTSSKETSSQVDPLPTPSVPGAVGSMKHLSAEPGQEHVGASPGLPKRSGTMMGRSDSSIRTAHFFDKEIEEGLCQESCRLLLEEIDRVAAIHRELEEYH